jgi:hypothetical protein
VLAARRDAWTARVVWGVWAALTVAAIGLILALGANVPFGDDWRDMVPFYSGALPVDAASLWHAHNEHHIVLSRMILIGLARLTDLDLRVGALLNAVLMSAASAILLWSAHRVDRRLRWADCALPLLLLHWGHYRTLLWSFQMHAALLVLFSSVLIAILFHRAEPPSLGITVLFGVCLLALPLCQAGGVAIAPVLAAWLGAVGVLGLRSPEPTRRRAGLAALALACAAVSLAAISYVPPAFRTGGDPAPVMWWGTVMLSTGFGVTERASPLTLLLPVLAAALLLSTGALLLRVVREQRSERVRALGLAAFLLAFLGLAIGIGWGRQSQALTNRYPALAAPFFCALYLCWRRYGPGRLGAGVCAAICAVLVALTPWNVVEGLGFARKRAEIAASFESDVRSGVPVEELVARYVPVLHHVKRTLRKGLIDLRAAQVGMFRSER